MKQIYRAQSLVEADVISSMLAAHGIRTFLPDEKMACSYPIIMMSTGIRLWVTENDYPFAQELLKEYEGQQS